MIALSYRKVLLKLRENKLADLSMEFAVNVLDAVDGIKGHSSLVNQIERSATSIGANIREANYGHGKPDFIAKLQIALKECYETEYWLELFKKAKLLDETKSKELTDKCGTIRRILVASINTTKNNMQKAKEATINMPNHNIIEITYKTFKGYNFIIS